MLDETQSKIIDATMTLIIEKGYSKATTKNIASLAGVNECTIFRRFREKKEIVLAAMALPQWNPCIKEEDFVYKGNLEEDLLGFAKVYMAKVTPKMVNISMGLRSAELEGVALPEIMKIPLVFKKVLLSYFAMMYAEKKIREANFEALALQFISLNLGFVLLDASFGEKLIGLSKEVYVQNSVETFAKGIRL